MTPGVTPRDPSRFYFYSCPTILNEALCYAICLIVLYVLFQTHCSPAHSVLGLRFNSNSKRARRSSSHCPLQHPCPFTWHSTWALGAGWLGVPWLAGNRRPVIPVSVGW